MNPIIFLTLEQILFIHNDQIDRYGGLKGIRDIGLLESAIAQPFVKFNKKFLHKNIYQMAAAYIYHICLNHPFNDGNKRTALVSMILFLKRNNIYFNCSEDAAEKFILQIANTKLSKSKIAQFIIKNSLKER